MENELINPYKLFTGSFLPNWLLQRKEISHGAKLCYARLCQYSGEDGLCYPKIDTLAEELGIEARMMSKYLKELKDNNLILVERRGLGKSNVYKFLAHNWMFAEKPKIRKAAKEEKEKKPDFIWAIVELFRECYQEEFGVEYEVVNEGKERKSAGALLKVAKLSNPDCSSDEMLSVMERYFKSVMKVGNVWYRTNMSLTTLSTRHNEIKQIIKTEQNETNNGQRNKDADYRRYKEAVAERQS